MFALQKQDNGMFKRLVRNLGKVTGLLVVLVAAALLLAPDASATPSATIDRSASGDSGERLEGEAALQEPLVPLPSTPAPMRIWEGPEGQPLPFGSDEEIMEFLRTAEVVEIENIEIGVTRPRRVTLEKGGIQVHAAFRDVDETHERVRMSDGRVRMKLRDYCMFECAAFELARILGMDNVPPAVVRRIEGKLGTLQIWVYNAVMEDERVEAGLRSPNQIAWRQQSMAMYLFDNLIGNDDRTQQNILIDKNWKIWLIDHTRAFYQDKEIQNLEKVIWVEKAFWDGLQAMDADMLDEYLSRFLTKYEIEKTLERRDKLVEHIQGLIDQRGPDAVLFTWGPPAPPGPPGS